MRYLSRKYHSARRWFFFKLLLIHVARNPGCMRIDDDLEF